MKKTYVLNVAGKNRDRLLDASKYDIRKYVKRERAKVLPEGADFWDFDCRIGIDATDAVAVHFAALMASIDELVHSNDVGKFYVEVVTKLGRRMARPATESIAEVVQQDQDR